MNFQFASSTTFSAADAFKAFNVIREATSKWLDEERKTRVVIARVEAQRDVLVSGVEAQRDFLLRALELSFDERRTSFQSLFSALDQALDTGDQSSVANILSAITELAKENPFTALRDHKIVIEQFQSDETWEV